MEKYLLGVDLGTSACKAALFNPGGEAVAQSSRAYPVFHPEEGFAEQDPKQWWEASCEAIREVISGSGIDPAAIAGIGIDGQSWSAVPMDAEGRELHNTPIWFDTRSAALCKEVEERVGKEEIFARSGNPFKPGYSLPKILWFQRNMPDVYEKTHCFLQSNGYLIYRLTGRFTQDRSQGYGLHCFDMRRGEWDEELCQRFLIDPRKLPKLYDCHEVVGTVTKKAAEQTHLKEGTPVVAGGLDAACGTLGAGVLREGETQEQGGQAGGMSICLESYRADPRLILSRHVVPGRWLLQGGTVGGGGVIRWFEEEFCAEERNVSKNPYAEMDRGAQTVAPGSEGVVFLPYMAGERSPIWDEKAKGVYYGLDYTKRRAHLIRASLEGVAFSLLHNLQAAEEAGAFVTELRSMGGAANSALWTQMKADVTGKTVVVPSSDTATTLGAAILAGVGVGLYPSFEEAAARTVRLKQTYVPDPSLSRQYAKAYETYLELYQSLSPLMHKDGTPVS